MAVRLHASQIKEFSHYRYTKRTQAITLDVENAGLLCIDNHIVEVGYTEPSYTCSPVCPSAR
jgi:hypothetical protein